MRPCATGTNVRLTRRPTRCDISSGYHHAGGVARPRAQGGQARARAASPWRTRTGARAMATRSIRGPTDRSSTIRVRRIRSGEGARLKAIRLAALADTPEAFARTLEEARLIPDEEYASRARSGEKGERSVFLVAEGDGGEWVG